MLLTKLHIPSSGKNLVHRTDLFNKLNEGLRCKLILISAPPGFGKTTLLSEWINQIKIPTAWVSLDKGDNDTSEFFRYLISGIQGINAPFGQAALGLLKSPTEPNPESIAGLLINDMLKIKQHFLLILDDFHLINNSKILNLLAYLLERIPENIHIVILTRSDPAIPLARLRSQHQLVELRSVDLSFSANEITDLFNKKLKCKLSVDDVHSLETKTEGWIAGLQLTALSIQNREDVSGFIKNLKGDNRYIMDYLMEEVLKNQPDEIREFLLLTSVLEQISASLCNAVLNRSDSVSILETLDKNNMFFVSLDNERQWYRYHHLFSDLLKQRFNQKEQSIVIDIHNKACIWYEQNNMVDLAIEHALEIKNYGKAIQLLGKIAERLWENGSQEAILKYGDILPDDLIKENADFCLYYAWILIAAGQIKKAEPFLTSAETIARNLIGHTNSSTEIIKYNKKLLGKISVAFAYLHSHLEHSDRIFDYCKNAMTYLSEADPLWISWAWFSNGIAHFSNGNIIKSNEAFQHAFEFGKKSSNLYQISTIAIRMAENEQQLGHYQSAYKKCTDFLTLMKDNGYAELAKTDWTFAALYFIMGVTHFMRADIAQANENIKIAYELSKSGKDIYLKLFILMVYTVLLRELGDSEAEQKINELEDLMKQKEIPPFLTAIHKGWKIYFLMEKGQLEEANNVAEACGLKLNDKRSQSNASSYAAYVRLLIAQNKLDDADLILSELYALASDTQGIETIIGLKISYAILFKKKGNRDKAVAYLIEAMEMAAGENLLYYFINDLPNTHDLLIDAFKHLATPNPKIPESFIINLKRVIESKLKTRKHQTNIEISTRELETLKLLDGDLSNQEIADKLFISLNTIKTHLKNIYLKLEVDSRTKAVAKAKDLGLI